MGTDSPLVPPTIFVSHDPMLLETRTKLLEEAGLHIMPSDPTDFPVLLSEFKFEVLILCNTLSQDEKQKLTAEFKRLNESGGVVSIQPPLERQVVDADIRMQAPVHPWEWQLLCRALKKRWN
jgi:hypothetical protein